MNLTAPPKYQGAGGPSLSAGTKELFKDTNPLMSSSQVILFGVVKQLVGSESGQKQSVKYLQNMVYSIIHPPPP